MRSPIAYAYIINQNNKSSYLRKKGLSDQEKAEGWIAVALYTADAMIYHFDGRWPENISFLFQDELKKIKGWE